VTLVSRAGVAFEILQDLDLRGEVGLVERITGLFGLIAAWLLLGFGSATSAQTSNVFTVAKYPVEASAANAVAAKSEASQQGRKSAFRSLLKRLVPANSYPLIEQLTKLDPEPYVGGVRVRKEETSRTQYIATLDFSFEPDAVRGLLTQHGIPIVDQAAPITSLLLLYQASPTIKESAMQPAQGAGAWRGVWKGLDLENSVAPAKLVQRPSDLTPEVATGLLRADPETLATVGGQYSTSQLVVVLAEPLMKTNELQVTMAGQDAVGRFSVTTRYRLDDEDFTYSLELAAVIAQGVLEGRWKAAQSGDVAINGVAGGGRFGGPVTPLTVLVEFGNLGQWQRQQQVLASTPGVSNLQIGSLSGRSASVSLSFPGGGEALQAALGRQGGVLENINGFWIMR